PVIFWSTTSGFCRQMSPRLADMPGEGPRVLLISRGEAEEHKQSAEQDKWKGDLVNVVLESNWDVTSAYQGGGTPTGYLLDAGGRVASSLAIGADALLQLAQAVPTPGR